MKKQLEIEENHGGSNEESNCSNSYKELKRSSLGKVDCKVLNLNLSFYFKLNKVKSASIFFGNSTLNHVNFLIFLFVPKLKQIIFTAKLSKQFFQVIIKFCKFILNL